MIRFGKDQIQQVNDETAQTVSCEWCSAGPGSDGRSCIVVRLEMMYTLASDRTTKRLIGKIVDGARVTINGVTCETNQNGDAFFKGLPDGTHSLHLQAAVGQQSVQRAGPDLARGINPPPPRMLRSARGTVVIQNGQVTSAEIDAGDTGHAWVFSVEDYRITVDWKADLILAHDNARSPRPAWVGGTQGIAAVICHQTGAGSSNISSTINTFINGGSGASAHYVVDLDGFMVKMVPDDEKAHHAGWSFLAGRRNVNNFSIGIETVNPSGAPFQEAQFSAIVGLILAYINHGSYAVTRHDAHGHSDIQTAQNQTIYSDDRANCPGLFFDWPTLAARGVGTRATSNLSHVYATHAKYHNYFYESGTVLRSGDGDGDDATPPTYGGVVRPQLQGRNLIARLQRDLARLGYSISPAFDPDQADDATHIHGQLIDGVFNAAMPKTIDRFRRHFLGQTGSEFTFGTAVALQAALADRGYG